VRPTVTKFFKKKKEKTLTPAGIRALYLSHYNDSATPAQALPENKTTIKEAATQKRSYLRNLVTSETPAFLISSVEPHNLAILYSMAHLFTYSLHGAQSFLRS